MSLFLSKRAAQQRLNTERSRQIPRCSRALHTLGRPISCEIEIDCCSGDRDVFEQLGLRRILSRTARYAEARVASRSRDRIGEMERHNALRFGIWQCAQQNAICQAEDRRGQADPSARTAHMTAVHPAISEHSQSISHVIKEESYLRPSHIPRVVSLINPTLPNSRRAADSASSALSPRSIRSRIAFADGSGSLLPALLHAVVVVATLELHASLSFLAGSGCLDGFRESLQRERSAAKCFLPAAVRR